MNWLKQQAANIAGTAEPIYGPEALQSVAKQAETTPYTELTKDDLTWVGMGTTNVESQQFYCFADSGHIAMVQIIYSNVQSIHTTCQFNAKIYYPDYPKTPHLWSANPLSNHGFTAEGTGFFADSVALELSEDGTYYTIKSAIDENAVVNLKVTRASPGFQVGKDGRTLYGTDHANPWGLMRHMFWPRCKIEGSIITKEGEIDFTGRGLYIMALQGMKPHHAAARWNFVDFQSPTYSAVMMQFTTPPAYGSTTVTVGGIAIDGAILTASANHTVKHLELRDDPDWPEPSSIAFEWNGTTKDGKAVKATLSGSMGERLDKVDVMAEVPGFIKSIVGGIAGTRPFIFQYGPKGLKLRVEVEGEEPKEEEGKYYGEATFISE